MTLQQIQRGALIGEVIAPIKSVRVVGRFHPFVGHRIEFESLAGLTVQEILDEAEESAEPLSRRLPVVVWIEGSPVPDELYQRVRLKPGTTMTFMPRLQGDNPLRTLLTVAVAIAAILVSGGAASFLGPAFAAGTFGASALSTGVLPWGQVVTNISFPASHKNEHHGFGRSNGTSCV